MTGSGTQIAFIGLGRMGGPMVRRLLAAGHDVTAFDVAPAARERARDDGARVAGDVGGTVAGAEIVILMLPDSAAVTSVLRDPDVLAHLHAGTTVVDMGSSEPFVTRQLGNELAHTGVTMVDAPVSGGVAGAERGSLAIMVGGSDDDVRRVEPVLASMGQVMRAGPLGAGHAVKALNNLLSATHLWITSEAIVAGQRFGLDPGTMLDIFNRSSGRSGSTENKWPNFILNGSYGSGFGLGLMRKDIGIAAGLAHESGAFRELALAVLDLWSRAADALPAASDHTEVARWIAAAADPAAGAADEPRAG